MKEKLIIGISGASGAIYGIKCLELLQQLDLETHLIISKAAALTITQETDWSIADVQQMADVYHTDMNIGASIASGSFKTMGMIIAPCSVKTMSEIATGCTGTLIARAADVVLKERRRLVIMLRETPLHAGHLKTMLQLTEMGAIIAPPMPAFYTKPQTIDDLVTQTSARILDYFHLNHHSTQRWNGL